tara:strand:+ start:32 stop:445 length:414 start_codon:yes stop_codon:yes gene_type:complete
VENKAFRTCWLSIKVQLTRLHRQTVKAVLKFNRAIKGLDKQTLKGELLLEVKLVVTLLVKRLLLADVSIRLVRTSVKTPLLVCLKQDSDSPVVARMCVESLEEPDKPHKASPLVLNSVLVNSDNRLSKTCQPEPKAV